MHKYLTPEEVVARAKALAVSCHAAQMYGDEPYTYHLEQVVSTLQRWGLNHHGITAAAWLHDALEDTNAARLDIEAIGKDVLWTVDLLTDPSEGTRSEKKKALYERYTKHERGFDYDSMGYWVGTWAAYVKAADRSVNQSNSISTKNMKKMKMYVKEFPEFIRVFSPRFIHDSQVWNELFEQYQAMVRVIDAEV